MPDAAPPISAIANFDGACLPRNPGGTATYGWVLYREDNGERGELMAQGHGVESRGPGASNNRGEYGGVIAVMNAALQMGVQNLVVRGDSELIIRQLRGVYAVRSSNLIELYRVAMDLASQFRKIRFEWVPREENARADRLSEIAYEELTGRRAGTDKPSKRPGQRAARSPSPGKLDDASTAGTPAAGSPGASRPKPGAWREEPASDKQRWLLQSLGHTDRTPLTRGQASDLIERLKGPK